MAEHNKKMATGEFLKFDDFEIKKMKFHCSNEVIDVNDVGIEKTVVFDKFAYGKVKKQM